MPRIASCPVVAMRSSAGATTSRSRAIIIRAPSAWLTITARECETTSCSSRAMRCRSS